MPKQAWIYNKWFDSIFILLPPFACMIAIVIFPAYFQSTPVSLFWWFSLVLCIDVAHVYSTIYRTYADKQALGQHRHFFMGLPIVLFVIGLLVYQTSPLYFWRLLAYIAVFHFVRQQYGFLRIYDRKAQQPAWARFTDMLTIYAATLYPILFWHLSGDREFHWFIEHDFFDLEGLRFLLPVFQWLYAIILLLYLCKEVLYIRRYRQINLPRNLVILGTTLSWYIGIVHFNGDLIFTLLNIVSHGIPYMALVWVYGRNKSQKEPVSKSFRFLFSNRFILVFVLSVITLAYFEEALWDVLVWKENRPFFPSGGIFRDISRLLPDTIVVPLLAVPQLTHYVIDGFIWKIRKDKFGWKQHTLEGKDAGSKTK